MPDTHSPKTYPDSGKGSSALGKVLGRSVPLSVKQTTLAMHGLARIVRRHS